jgi:hypothetical protein
MKPWEAEGISRATWYRRQHRKTSGETETIDETAVRETAETMGQASETETAVAETAETTAAETGETPPRETSRPPRYDRIARAGCSGTLAVRRPSMASW